MPWFDGTNIRLLRTTKPVPPHELHSILTPGAAAQPSKQVAIHTTPQGASVNTPARQATKLGQEVHGCVPSASLFSFSSYWKQHICATRPRR